MKLLLFYIFPITKDTGIGKKDRIIQALRKKPVDDQISKHIKDKIGTFDDLAENYSKREAAKLFAHLFSPEVSQKLCSDAKLVEGKVFLLVFDQAEGQNELFTNENDWLDFFARLSELYNTMPNFVILFSVTLRLVSYLREVCERQFRDRIIASDDFLLRNPNQQQIIQMYKSRMHLWLKDDQEILAQYEKLNFPTIPYTENEIKKLENYAIRAILDTLDKEFHNKLEQVISNPETDYLYVINNTKDEQINLQSLNEFCKSINTENWNWLFQEFAIKITAVDSVTSSHMAEFGKHTVNRPESFTVTFSDGIDENKFVRVRIVILKNFNPFRQGIMSFLYKQKILKNAVCLLRNSDFEFDVPLLENYTQRVYKFIHEVNIGKSFFGIQYLIQNRASYEANSTWDQARSLILHKMSTSFFWQLAPKVRLLLNQQQSGDQQQTGNEPLIIDAD